MGNTLLSWYKTKCKQTWKTAFFSAVIIGLVIHLYKLTNALPNHDTLYNYFNERNRLGLGRWFLWIGTLLTSNFSLPWINGLVSILLLSLSTVVIVEVLNIKNPIVICMTAGLLLGYPATTGVMLYQFTADVYALGLLLSCLAVTLTSPASGKALQGRKISRGGVAIGTVCMTLAMGIYQAYLSFGLVLSLAWLILNQLRGSMSNKERKSWILSQIIMYACAMALYYGIWKLCMVVAGSNGGSYQGISGLGLSLSTIFAGFGKTALKTILLFVDQNPLKSGLSPYGVINCIFLVMALTTIIVAICKTRLYQKKSSLVWVLVAVAAIPLCVFIWYFTSDEVWYRCTMQQSAVVFYIMTAVLCEEFLKPRLRTVAAFILLVVIVNNAISANIAYFYMDKAYTATQAMATEMNTRIHKEDPDAAEIAVVGALNDNNSLYLKTDEATVNLPGMLREELFVHLLLDQDHVVNFMNQSFGEDYQGADPETVEKLQKNPKIQQMPVWPAEGSVQSVDGVVVIKVKDEK